VIIKGFLSGFIGLLLAVVYQFGVHSLLSWQTWSIFALSIVYLLVWKKDAIWLILAIICVSLLLF
jgi:chromate transport protein ChrA